MATLVTRTTDQPDGTTAKGSELTHAEVDANFINLNSDKVEVSGAIVFAAKAGEALAMGDVVYVSGVSGNEPVVSKADANDASKMPAFGLAEADANLNAAVNVVTFGTLYDLDTSAFSAGDTVYVSTTAGGLTATKPTGEASLIQNIGKVIRPHASAGSIKVGGAGRSNDTPNLNNGNVFIGNASNQAETRALVEADISDLQTYLTAETNDLSSAVTWANVPNANITESSVTQHQAALSITESQISDLGTYLTAESDTLATVTARGASTNDNVTFNGTVDIGSHLTVDTDTLYVNAQGNQIAFGTSTPSTGYELTVKDPNATASIEEIKWLFDASSAGIVRNVRLEFEGFTSGSIGLSSSAAGGTYLDNATGGCGISAKGNGTVGLYTNGSILSPDVVLDGSGNLDISANVIVDGFVEATEFRTASTSTTALTLSATGGATVGEDLTVTGNFTSTGIDDNATSTAITIDASENVGIGVSSMNHNLQLPQVAGTSLSFSNDVGFSLDSTTCAYYGLTYTQPTGKFNVVLSAFSDLLLATNGAERMRIDSSGTVQFQHAIEEQQYSLTGTAIDPSNGTIQYKTLGANTTFTESLANGEFVTLMINDGAGYTITWPTTTWVGGSAPTLETTGYNVIELWHVNGTLYGAFVGAA